MAHPFQKDLTAEYRTLRGQVRNTDIMISTSASPVDIDLKYNHIKSIFEELDNAIDRYATSCRRSNYRPGVDKLDANEVVNLIKLCKSQILSLNNEANMLRKNGNSPRQILSMQQYFTNRLGTTLEKYNRINHDYVEFLNTIESNDEDIKVSKTDAVNMFAKADDEENALIELIENERSEEIAAIARSMQELYDIFVELQSLITSQGEGINQIEANTEQVVVNIEHAADSLETADRHHKKYDKKCFIIILVILCILLLVVLIAQKS